MLTTVSLQNFKCLLDVTVQLDPLTVLIGPNDSGKSSLLDAIHLLGRTALDPLFQVFGLSNDVRDLSQLRNLVWWRDEELTINWRAEGEALGRQFVYRLGLPALLDGGPLQAPQQPRYLFSEHLTVGGERLFDTDAGHPPVGRPFTIGEKDFGLVRGKTVLSSLTQQQAPHFGAVARALSSTVKYQLDPEALRSTAQPEPSPQLSPTGSNLAAVLENIRTGKDLSAALGLDRTLQEAIPTLSGIALPTVQQPQYAKALEFTLADDGEAVTIPARQASDGAVLLIAFLALAYGNTPDILLIEEPENGLHPSRLQLVIDILYKISKGEIGTRPRQVILTTHSPLLLNFVRPENVRIFRRDDTGATQVTAMSAVPNLSNLLKEFATGELWYLFGEEELVKGAKG
jgi:predicted ATPase